jgi:hypothetical protein
MQIDPTRRREHDAEPTTPDAQPRTPDAQPLTRAHETLLDGTARLYAQNATRNATANPGATLGRAPAFDDRVMYVGMNSTVLHGEAQNHREARNLAFDVVIAHAEDGPDGADHVRVNGQLFDLSTAQGADAFVATLGLPVAQSKAIATVLHRAGSGSRDELANIATVWARAEHGGTIPSRLVLSGHCGGSSVYDGAGKDGELGFASVQALADAMPAAAARVEDVMISACNSGHDDRGTALTSWQQHFPNLKTAWGYAADDSHSPTEAHAVAHIAAWKVATAGRASHVDGAAQVRAEYHREWRAQHGSDAPTDREPRAFAAENVATWTATDGYRRGH